MEGTWAHVTQIERQGSSQFFVYNIETQTWRSLKSMPDSRYAHSMVLHLSSLSKPTLYVIGGTNKHDYKTINSYDIESDTWTASALPQPVKLRFFSVSAIVGEILYVIGGRYMKQKPPERQKTTEMVEKIDLKTKVWETCASLSKPMYFGSTSCISVFDNKIILYFVERFIMYDCGTNTWKPLRHHRQLLSGVL